jgi:hypothetical protein
MSREVIMLRYIGHGAWLPDIPARDLTDEEVEQHGGEKALVASGLYEKVKPAKAEKENQS